MPNCNSHFEGALEDMNTYGKTPLRKEHCRGETQKCNFPSQLTPKSCPLQWEELQCQLPRQQNQCFLVSASGQTSPSEKAFQFTVFHLVIGYVGVFFREKCDPYFSCPRDDTRFKKISSEFKEGVVTLQGPHRASYIGLTTLIECSFSGQLNHQDFKITPSCTI